MDIGLYNYTGPWNKLVKSTGMEAVASYTGAVTRMSMSIINPVLKLEESAANINGANYMYISDFDRYYQIVDKKCDENGLWTISCKEDVLASFKSDIKSLRGIVKRQADNYDMYLNDPRIPVSAQKVMSIKRFGSTIFTQSASTSAENFKTITLLVLGG